MPRRSEIDRRADEAVYRWIVLPIIILLGIYIAASLIDSMLGLHNATFVQIFTGIGGVVAFILYFKKQFEKETE